MDLIKKATSRKKSARGTAYKKTFDNILIFNFFRIGQVSVPH